jgi:hypothetical protein
MAVPSWRDTEQLLHRLQRSAPEERVRHDYREPLIRVIADGSDGYQTV